MAIVITLNGTDVTSRVSLETVRVVNTLALKADTMDFDLVVPVGGTIPRAGNEVVFTVGGVREFAGRLLRVRESQETPGVSYRYRCSARDYSWEFDKRMVTETFPSPPALTMNADAIVKAIVDGWTTGFTYANVQSSYPLATQTFNDVYPSDAIKQLADALEWIFYIDYNRDVHFKPLVANLSPLPSNMLEVDTDTANYRDLELEEDVSQVKTRLYLHDVRVRNQYAMTRNHTGDGTTEWFSLGYEPYSLTGATVQVGGVPYDVVWEGTDGKPGDGQTNQKAYLCADNMGVRITPAPANGAAVQASIYPVDTIPKLMWEDPDAMADMAAREGGNGVHEFALQDPNVNGPDETTAQARAQLMLYKYGRVRRSGSFGSDLQGWRAGQYFTLKSAYRFGGDFAAGMRMYVLQVEKQIITAGAGGDRLRYTIGIANTPYSW